MRQFRPSSYTTIKQLFIWHHGPSLSLTSCIHGFSIYQKISSCFFYTQASYIQLLWHPSNRLTLWSVTCTGFIKIYFAFFKVCEQLCTDRNIWETKQNWGSKKKLSVFMTFFFWETQKLISPISNIHSVALEPTSAVAFSIICLFL